MLALISVRLVLALAVWRHVQRGAGASRKFGAATGTLFSIVSMLQFHLPFYAADHCPTHCACACSHAWRWLIQGVMSWDDPANLVSELGSRSLPWHLLLPH